MMRLKRPTGLVTLFSFVFLALSPALRAQQDQSAIIDAQSIHHPAVARTGMVATQQELASRVGAEILAEGGNAVDAAVAVGFALAVVLPRAGNIGGGGFMLVHLAEEDRTIAIDYREKAPAAATADMYLNLDGSVNPNLSRFTRLAAGVPGTVAGLLMALERYGTMDRAAVMAPAIRLAEEGFPVTLYLSQGLKSRAGNMLRHAASREVFYKAGGVPYEPGDIFVQPDLARTLRLIARDGAAAFYEGDIADLIVADMEQHGGLITHEDLRAYEAVERSPVTGTYRGYEIASMPPPSSGGVHIVQMLNVLENFSMGGFGPDSADALHLMAAAMKRAYADRSTHLADPDYYDNPLGWLTSKDYAREIAAGISMGQAIPSSQIAPGTPPTEESPDTTHFSVMDAAGNAVVNTYTLNFSYGSGITVAGAGFLLNNEMDDFVAKPGVPNAFGLVGDDTNGIEPGKRPLSSMTPTIVFREGEPYLLLGSPGGSRIITSVLQVIVDVIDHRSGLADAVASPRIHHQWLPDILFMEPGFSAETILELQSRGYQLQRSGTMGSVQAIMAEDGYLYGASDPRRPYALALGLCVAGTVGNC